MYRLVYYVNGKEFEVVIPSAPYGVCVSKKKAIQNTTHKFGTLSIERL